MKKSLSSAATEEPRKVLPPTQHHLLNFLIMQNFNEQKTKCNFQIRNLKYFENFTNDLKNASLMNTSDALSIYEISNRFHTNLVNTVNKHVPLNIISNRETKPWINNKMPLKLNKTIQHLSKIFKIKGYILVWSL